MQYGYVRYRDHLIWLGNDGKGGWWCKVSTADVTHEPYDRDARGPFPTSRAAVEEAERMIAGLEPER